MQFIEESLRWEIFVLWIGAVANAANGIPPVIEEELESRIPGFRARVREELEFSTRKDAVGERLWNLVGAWIAVAEVPQLGNATYVFTRPSNIREFVGRYATTTRDDIRRNRGNIATELGFIGRVMHGNHPKKWLNDLRARIGEPVVYTLTAAAM
jgi:hypothetical protein